jgi:hypothetical protein
MLRVALFPLAAAVLLVSVVHGRSQPAVSGVSATCDESSIAGESYRLTTEAQAHNVLRPRDRWWEPYGIWNGPREIGHPNEASIRLAERAKELDESNLLAHGYLARQYVVMAIDAEKAKTEWSRVVAGGGAITWTASLYEVDPRSYFLFAFDRRGIRVFRFAQLAGELRTHFGVPDFPGPDRIEFWRALGGCLPANTSAEVEIPWSSVREIGVTPWTVRFDLRDRVKITSDRRRQRIDDTLEVNLHPGVGEIDFRLNMTPFGTRVVGAAPDAYHQRVKQMLENLR